MADPLDNDADAADPGASQPVVPRKGTADDAIDATIIGAPRTADDDGNVALPDVLTEPRQSGDIESHVAQTWTSPFESDHSPCATMAAQTTADVAAASDHTVTLTSTVGEVGLVSAHGFQASVSHCWTSQWSAPQNLIHVL